MLLQICWFALWAVLMILLREGVKRVCGEKYFNKVLTDTCGAFLGSFTMMYIVGGTFHFAPVWVSLFYLSAGFVFFALMHGAFPHLWSRKTSEMFSR